MGGGSGLVLGSGVLVGCEYSGTVRDRYRARGYDAWSNDIIATSADPEYHLLMDVMCAIRLRRWRQIILHIPCTAMALCGNKHYGNDMPKNAERIAAIEWSKQVVQCALDHADMVAVENPSSVIFPVLRKMGADVQFVQPYQFCHPEQKNTGLALWGLPRLKPTYDVYEIMMTLPKRERERIFHMGPSVDRGHLRSKFYFGFAEAMAAQWGALI